VYAARAAWLMDGWDYRHNPQEPIVALGENANFFAQSLSLDLDDLFEEPEAVVYPSERRSRSAPQGTIVGELDKDALLNALDQQLADHPEMSEAEAFEAAISVAHGENVTEWVGAIADVLEGQEGRSLVEVQRRSGMPWVEVWLALLGGYGLEQRGSSMSEQRFGLGRFSRERERRTASKSSGFSSTRRSCTDYNFRHLI
jgi:hypothetical protein